MKITKFVHSCLLVEADGRVVLFDPGVYSPIDIEALNVLDDVLITHEHPDHMDIEKVKQLQSKFPKLRITTTSNAKKMLDETGIAGVQVAPPDGVLFFDSPHEMIRPFADSDPPEEIGIHYLDQFTDPGDSHHFTETKAILALPVSAPWGSTVRAAAVALELKPKFIIPVHDWHWHDEAKQQIYGRLEQVFAEAGITFIKMIDGIAVELSM